MSEENKNVVVDGFGADWFAKTKANEGGAFLRHPIGDYRLRLQDIEIKAKEGANPHNMLVVTFETIALAGDGDSTAIGTSPAPVRYGTPQSPKFMQQRTKCLLDALGVRGPFSPASLIGREIDATITWEKSMVEIDPISGEERVFVNDRISFERKAGSPKPPKANAKAASAAAQKYLSEKEAGDGETVNKDQPAWEAQAQPAASAKVEELPSMGSWMDEATVPKGAHLYRALIALDKPQAATAKASLIAKRIDPKGPINADNISEPDRSEYISWMAKQLTMNQANQGGGNGLPDLDDDAPAKRRTGSRTRPPHAA